MGSDERRALEERQPLSVGCGMHNNRIGPLAERTTQRASKAGVPPPSCAARRNVRARDRVHGELGGVLRSWLSSARLGEHERACPM